METTRTSNRVLTTVFIISFLNLIGFGIVIPLIPYYAEGFGANTAVVGFLIGSYAAAQFLGAPLWGRISDHRGRKPVLVVTIIGSVLGYILFGLANSLLILFVSRIFTGFTNGNISVAQAIVTDITDERDRARGLGLIGAAFGLGLILGPALGGFLSRWGYDWPAYAAAFLNFLSLFSVFIWLPETSPRGAERAVATGGNAFSWRALTNALRRPLVGPVLQVRFVFALSFSTFATVFAIYAEFGLGYSAQTTAYLLAYVGGLMVVVQSLLIAPLTVRFGEKRLLLYSIFLMTLSLIGWAFSRNLILLGLVLIPLALAGGVFNTVINSLLSKLVPEYEVGGMLGISASLESSTRIIAPSIGGYLMQNFGLSAPGVVSAAILVAVLPSAWRLFREGKRSPEE